MNKSVYIRILMLILFMFLVQSCANTGKVRSELDTSKEVVEEGIEDTSTSHEHSKETDQQGKDRMKKKVDKETERKKNKNQDIATESGKVINGLADLRNNIEEIKNNGAKSLKGGSLDVWSDTDEDLGGLDDIDLPEVDESDEEVSGTTQAGEKNEVVAGTATAIHGEIGSTHFIGTASQDDFSDLDDFDKKNSVTEDVRIKNIVYQWAKSWSEKKFSLYISFYSDNEFQPEKGMSYQGWLNQRRVRFQKSYINVEVDSLNVEIINPNQASVTFNQKYNSDNYEDHTSKLLVMRKINDIWLITRERTLRVLR